MDRDQDDATDGPNGAEKRGSLYSMRPGAAHTKPPPAKRNLLAQVAAELADHFDLELDYAEDLAYLSVARSVLILVEMAEAAGIDPRDERVLTWVGIGLMEVLREADGAPQPANDY